MDYEKKYKELLARLQKAKENEEVNDERYCCVIDDIVSELKESEEEKIRKSLIELFKDMEWDDSTFHDYNLDKGETVAWLEKQGEQKPAEWSEEDETYLSHVITAIKLYYTDDKECENPWREELLRWLKSIKSHKQGERTSPQINERAWLHLVSDVLTWKDGIGQYLDDPRVQELAKKLCSEYAQKLYNSVQDVTFEQKPIKREYFITITAGCYAVIKDNEIHIKKEDKTALEAINEEKVDNANKVEPKFKVGEWIIQENIGVYKVAEICESWYEVIDVENNHYSIGFDKEYMCHLWTIEDAKDGDVLATEDWIFIFEKMSSNGKPVCHCHYDIELGFRIDANSYIATGSEIYPATKEQRDLLFAKMKEAGYEWNSEKKELEPPYKCEVVPHSRKGLEMIM